MVSSDRTSTDRLGVDAEDAPSPITAVVFGGRNYQDMRRAYGFLDKARDTLGLTEIICGYNPENDRWQGADQLAYQWAKAANFPVRCFPADWKTFKRAAGPIRNSQMAAELPAWGIAFPGGTGTADMRKKARAVGAFVFDIADGALERQDETVGLTRDEHDPTIINLEGR